METIPDFNDITDLNSQWRKKIHVLKQFCTKVFGPDQTHLIVRALNGKWNWEMLDPLKESSPLHDLRKSTTPHKNTSTKPSGSLTTKIRVVKKLCDLSGGGDTKHFLLHRIMNPSWDITEDFISAIAKVSKKSSQKTIIKRVLIASSKKKNAR